MLQAILSSIIIKFVAEKRHYGGKQLPNNKYCGYQTGFDSIHSCFNITKINAKVACLVVKPSFKRYSKRLGQYVLYIYIIISYYMVALSILLCALIPL